MKAYILKEEDFKRLHEKLELRFFQKKQIAKEEEFLLHDLYRWMNYVVCEWESEVTKS